MTDKDIVLSYGADPAATMGSLGRLSGFGSWTVEYIAMRALGWSDAFLPTDHGIRRVLSNRTTREISALSRKWSPWRSYAAILLWRKLNIESSLK